MVSTERECFDDVVTRYGTRVRYWCYRFTGDREAACDLAQDVLLRAFRKYHTFRGDSHLSTWLYVIARNHCANEMHRRRHDALPLEERFAVKLPDRSTERADVRLERRQAAQKSVTSLFRRLNRREAEVLWMHYGHEATLESITRTLGLTNRSGAKAFIVSARRKLLRTAG